MWQINAKNNNSIRSKISLISIIIAGFDALSSRVVTLKQIWQTWGKHKQTHVPHICLHLKWGGDVVLGEAKLQLHLPGTPAPGEDAASGHCFQVGPHKLRFGLQRKEGGLEL